MGRTRVVVVKSPYWSISGGSKGRVVDQKPHGYRVQFKKPARTGFFYGYELRRLE